MQLKIILLLSFFSCISLISFSQKDSTKRPTVDITSAYRPVLRNAAKINFSASNLPSDTNKNISPYNVPPQNLFYTYQPGPLKPLALDHDSALDLGIRNFIKLGVGNYSTPYARAGFSFGDGKSGLANVYADYISSKGSIENQDYSQLNIKARGSYFSEKNELYAGVGLTQSDYYLYGYDHLLHTYNKDDLRQRFSDLNIDAGFKNKIITETGINYDPNVKVSIFTNQNKVTENSLVAEAPVIKTFGDVFSIKLAALADLTSYTTNNLPVEIHINNNFFQLEPELIYSKPALSIHAGIKPVWDNGKLNVLPGIYGEAQLKDKGFLVQAGLVGRIIKNSYRNLSYINPYLDILSEQRNTREIELYGGIKTSVGKHFNFNAKAGLIGYRNLPFFVNDTTGDGKSFMVSNESSVTDLRLHADMGFISQDKFTITAGFTFNGYTAMADNLKAWGAIPFEITGSLRWWAFKQVLLKGDFRSFTGAPYLLNGNTFQTLSGAADLSAGVEFAITKKISLWADLNNILNNKYERWHNYPVYGLNVLAGAMVKF